MTTPERRQSGWWGSISGGLFGSAAKRRSEPERIEPRPEPTRLNVPARNSILENGAHHDTPRPRVSFQEDDRATSPESPAKRASAAQMATRKIFERPQGPSSKLSSSTVRATNFSAVASPRPMFRASSAAPEGGRFQFTPRAGTPARPTNNAFRTTTTATSAPTPSRDFRASTTESISRGMAKVPPSELFSMKIPEPPANLTGEELARRIPQNPNRVGSIYADEYLSDLCPKDFNETQRKQFFCILDLRRLKYASDEIYIKKDWRFNILNFAKEYEKSRSLIMLRYGLYEFKSIKPSQEVVSKWKASHGIPLDDEEDDTSVPSAALTRPNGTEGILSRGKRKASDEPSQSKRARGTEREPLSETATPALNKGSKKRMADDDGENPPAKSQKSAPATSKTPSATKKFFEQVANSKPTSSPSITVEPPSASKPKPAFSSAFGATSNSSTTKSIFEASASSKSTSGKLGAKSNIFGHLSDTGSAQASGAENDAEDENDSEDDAQEASQSDDQSGAASGGVATPQPDGDLFGKKRSAGGPFVSSSTSSEAGDAQSGPSLFDRVTKGDDGKPKRIFSSSTSAVASPATTKPASDNEKAPSPVKPQQPLGGNQTWSVDSPIKFAAAPSTSSSLFGSASAAAKSSATGQDLTTSNAAPKLFSFDSKPAETGAGSTPKFGTSGAGSTTSSLFGAKTNGSTPEASKESKTTEATPSAAPAQKAPHPMFGAVPGQESKPSFTVPGQSDSKPVFGAAKPLFGADPSGSESAKPMFGAATASDKPKADPSPLFGSKTAASAPQASSLFGSTASTPNPPSSLGSSQEAPKPLFGQAAAKDAPAPSFSFGAKQDTPKPLFGQEGAKDTPKPTFSFGDSSQKPQAPSLFGAAGGQSTPATPAFGAPKRSAESEETGEPQAKRSMFGSAAPAATPNPPTSLFGNTATPAAATTTPSLFGGAATADNNTPAPSFTFGGAAEKASSSTPLFGANSTAGASTPSFSFGAGAANGTSTPSFSFGGGATQNGASTPAPSFNFGAAGQTNGQASNQNSTLFGTSVSAPSSFTFGAGGGGDKAFNNPFASGGGGDAAGSVSFNFGASSAQPAPTGGSSGMFNFSSGGANGASTPVFSFGGGQTNGTTPNPGNAAAGGSIFNLAPPVGGTSTGTNTPFTFGGASSLATTPAAGTPEPAATGDADGQKADGDEEPQAQINLTEGGPGEEDEVVVFEVRAKALKLINKADESDEEGAKKDDKKSPWKTMGVGPFRLLKHKTTDAVRILLRGEPRGNVVMNKLLLHNFDYKTEPGDKYVKVTTAKDGGGLETWMLQVKDKTKGKELAAALTKHKEANKPKD
ncbi:hypothetical protein MCOR02_003346 [Pyricularia oryzae]|nr:hypothetical protein MCOR02_003346 [Pyricularia oryzae]KAI6322133.1 hypothetical protein MCOR34_002281 [Pyricularia oryzae]KAI6383025.1 hypothetical protein MCOR32_002910 [Pyricularia oryzae]KAI6453837.1 hypothetical protein MCOR17_009192 [Pyricularia oryzae]KAI6488039.1 hypothetical protein MCOR11_008631 [Pyricularia oryzae]